MCPNYAVHNCTTCCTCDNRQVCQVFIDRTVYINKKNNRQYTEAYRGIECAPEASWGGRESFRTCLLVVAEPTLT